ncbi:hypothetical protein ACFL6I_16290 [candidate division KSB1 bacterium]
MENIWRGILVLKLIFVVKIGSKGLFQQVLLQTEKLDEKMPGEMCREKILGKTKSIS